MSVAESPSSGMGGGGGGKAMDGLFKHIGNRAWFARVLSYWGHLETARFEIRTEEINSTSCVITASAPTNDHAQIRFCPL